MAAKKKPTKKPARSTKKKPRNAKPKRAPLDYRQLVIRDGVRLKYLAEVPWENSTATGDAREHLLREALAKRIGANFSIDKGEIIDANGRRTREFDLIIYDNRVAAAVDEDRLRKLIRVEAVVAVIEVKSNYTTQTEKQLWRPSKSGLVELHNLVRRFKPGPAAERYTLDATLFIEQTKGDREFVSTHTPRQMARDLNRFERVWVQGLGARDPLFMTNWHGKQIVLRHHIPELVFAYKGSLPNKKAGPQDLPWDYLCILGKGFYVDHGPKDAEQGEESFASFVGIVELFVNQYLQSCNYLSAAWYYYQFKEEEWAEVEALILRSARPKLKPSPKSRKAHAPFPGVLPDETVGALAIVTNVPTEELATRLADAANWIPATYPMQVRPAWEHPAYSSNGEVVVQLPFPCFEVDLGTHLAIVMAHKGIYDCVSCFAKPPSEEG